MEGRGFKKLEKAREEILPWNLQKGMQHRQHLNFSPVRPIADFWLTELYDNKFVLL